MLEKVTKLENHPFVVGWEMVVISTWVDVDQSLVNSWDGEDDVWWPGLAFRGDRVTSADEDDDEFAAAGTWVTAVCTGIIVGGGYQ